jgi:hypothetical protein
MTQALVLRTRELVVIYRLQLTSDRRFDLYETDCRRDDSIDRWTRVASKRSDPGTATPTRLLFRILPSKPQENWVFLRACVSSTSVVVLAGSLCKSYLAIPSHVPALAWAGIFQQQSLPALACASTELRCPAKPEAECPGPFSLLTLPAIRHGLLTTVHEDLGLWVAGHHSHQRKSGSTGKSRADRYRNG